MQKRGRARALRWGRVESRFGNGRSVGGNGLGDRGGVARRERQTDERGDLARLHSVGRIGSRRLTRAAASCSSSSSQRASRSAGRMTGIQLWMGWMTSFASVVMMVHETTGSPFGSRHVYQRPAKANAPPRCQRDAHRPLSRAISLPLVEAVGGDQAAPALQGGTEAGLVGDPLGPRIDHGSPSVPLTPNRRPTAPQCQRRPAP